MSKSTSTAARLETAAPNGEVTPFPTTASIKAAADKAVPRARAGAAAAAKPATRAKAAAAGIETAKPAAAKAVPAAAKAVVKAKAVPAARKQAPPVPAPPVPAAAVPPASRAAVAKRATRPAVPKTSAKPRAPAAPVEAAVREKAHKPKLVRDSFTMPEQEYAVLNQVKKACLKAGFEIKKSELLRIGVAAVSQLDMATLQRVLSELPQLKTGRPKKSSAVVNVK